MQNLTEEQVLALAPDEASKKAGKDLSSGKKWQNLGVSTEALWGECQGSGSNPYKTQVDLTELAYKCSCPSQKFPCKHSLGLLLMYAKNPANFNSAEPDWVSEWISKRKEKALKKAEKAENLKPVDLEAQAKRSAARQKKVSDGLSELEIRIKDIIRQGILSIPEQSTELFENIAKRLVDAQAPALATQFRNLEELNFFKEGWEKPLLEQLIRIWLICKAYPQVEHYPEPLKTEILSLIGFPQAQEEIKSLPGIEDHWLVLSKDEHYQNKIVTEKYWLFGLESGKTAIFYQFLAPQVRPEFNLIPGFVYDATVHQYPALWPQRVLISSMKGIIYHKKQPKAFQNLNELASYHQQISQMDPFIKEFATCVEQLKLAKSKNQWILQDNEQKNLRIDITEEEVWKILAVSAGKPVTMAIAGFGNQYFIKGFWQNQKYHVL